MSEEEKKNFYKGLLERAEQQRLDWLFEEPCTYEDEIEEDAWQLTLYTIEWFYMTLHYGIQTLQSWVA